MKRLLLLIAVVLLGWTSISEALLVVGDSGASQYTQGSGAGVGWGYVGNLITNATGNAHSSVTYVSNGWFTTANHVWTGDVTGTRHQETLSLGGFEYSINMGSYTNISGADLCMFRVNEMVGLPAGMAVLEETPHWTDSLRLIGNGYDNGGSPGLTWGNGTPYRSGASTLTLSVGDTQSYLSVYDSGTEGSAYGQTYDSGGGVFVDDQLAGIMISIGSYGGEDVTVITDFSVYGQQITSIAAIPEPSVLVLGLIVPALAVFIRRRFLI